MTRDELIEHTQQLIPRLNDDREILGVYAEAREFLRAPVDLPQVRGR